MLDGEKAFYTAAEAAEIFGKDKRTIHRWIQAEVSRFPNAERTSAGYVIPAADIEAELERQSGLKQK